MDQAEAPPLKTHQQHPEEVEHHENGASKMFRKVKAKATKLKNSLTKHGQSHEHDHDMVEEDDEDDELEPEVNSAPGVTGKHETLSHPRETNVPAPEEIIPPGTKVFPVVSSDYTKPSEPVPLQDISYGYEAPPQSVRPTDILDKEERKEAPTHHTLSELSEKKESREACEPMNTPVSLLSGTKDVTRTFTPSGEDDHLGGQRKVNVETPVKLEDDPAVPGGGLDHLSGVSNYQSKEGSGEAGVPEIADSLGRLNVTDESADQKQGQGFERDLSTRSKEFKDFDQDFDSVMGKDSPSKFAGERREAPNHPPRSELWDREESREATTHHPLSELSDKEESREARELMNTPVSLLSGTEDVMRTFAPSGEDGHFGGQRKVNVETPVKLEDDPAGQGGGFSGASNYQSKVTNPTKEGSGEAGVPEIAESLGRMNVTDEFTDQKQGQGFERDLSTRSKEFKEFDQDFDSVLGKDSPSKFAGESESELEKGFSTRSHDYDMSTESGMDKNSPSRSHEFDLNTESRIDKNSLMGVGSESGTGLGRELPTKSKQYGQKIESGRNEYSPESEGGLGAPLGGNFPVRSHKVDVKKEYGIDKDSPTGFGREPDFLAKGRPGYGEESEERNFQPRSDDDVKAETELGRDSPMGTYDQFSPELARPKERDEFEESRDDFEETRDETTQETKPKTYIEQFASMLGYSGESPVGNQTQVAGTVDEKLTPVNEKDQETESAVTTKLPLSGGESGVEKTKQGEEKGVSGRDFLTEKLTPGEEDKALSEVVAEKLQIGGGGEEKKTTTKEIEVKVEKIPTEKLSEEEEQGEAVEEEVKGGVIGRIKGWFGGGEEVKPKSPHSVEESSQSPGSTVGTKGFPDSGGSELGETCVGGGAVPVQKGV